MVQAVDPQPGEIVQDPAAGTGGFLVAAANHIRTRDPAVVDAKTMQLSTNQFHGVELVPGTFRLCLMNLSLHGVQARIVLGSTLSPDGAKLARPDVILTNPPFGSRRGADAIDRADLPFSHVSVLVTRLLTCSTKQM